MKLPKSLRTKIRTTPEISAWFIWIKKTPFVDFQAFLSELILPEALRRQIHTLYLILDNGGTHAPKQLKNWLQEYVRQNN